jgi:hypothetical protein
MSALTSTPVVGGKESLAVRAFGSFMADYAAEEGIMALTKDNLITRLRAHTDVLSGIPLNVNPLTRYCYCCLI